MKSRPIGVFDSGVGGVSLWRELHRALPDESLIYLGDGLNCPYGSRDEQQVKSLTQSAVEDLMDRGCKLIVVACNTATAAAISDLRAKYPDFAFVGMEPAIKPACLATKSGVVGVLATERSLSGEMFSRTAAKYASNIKVVTSVGEGFVEIVEQDLEGSEMARESVRKALKPILDAGADQIVLGCTHYPFLMADIRSQVGEGVQIIDPSPAVVRRVIELLRSGDILAPSGADTTMEFLTYSTEEYRQWLRAKALGEGRE